MRAGRVSSATLLLVLTASVLQVSCAGDLYWEGEEEFLTVNDDSSIGDHLQRLKRDTSSWFDPFGLLQPKDDDAEDSVTESSDPDDSAGYGKDDEIPTDNFGSGSPDKTEPEPKEKTLRVTFLVMEPCPSPLNRDSPAFLNISHSLENAVDLLYDSLPGTQRSTLVRVQNLETDDFLCKITLDIVTTGYYDTDNIKDILRNQIKNNGRLGGTAVRDGDFSAQLIDPGATLHCDDSEFKCDENVCLRMSAKCNGVVDCSDGTDESDCPSTAAAEPSPVDQGTSDDYNNGVDRDDQSNYDQIPENSDESNPDDNRNEVPDTRTPDNEDIYNETNSYEQRPDGDARSPDQTDDRYPVSSTKSFGSPDWDSGSWTQERGDLSGENDPYATEPQPSPTTTQPEYDITTPRYTRIDCSPNHMQCDETRCVELRLRCDGVNDCNDGADEANCPDDAYQPNDFDCCTKASPLDYHDNGIEAAYMPPTMTPSKEGDSLYQDVCPSHWRSFLTAFSVAWFPLEYIFASTTISFISYVACPLPLKFANSVSSTLILLRIPSI